MLQQEDPFELQFDTESYTTVIRKDIVPQSALWDRSCANFNGMQAQLQEDQCIIYNQGRLRWVDTVDMQVRELDFESSKLNLRQAWLDHGYLITISEMTGSNRDLVELRKVSNQKIVSHSSFSVEQKNIATSIKIVETKDPLTQQVDQRLLTLLLGCQEIEVRRVLTDGQLSYEGSISLVNQGDLQAEDFFLINQQNKLVINYSDSELAMVDLHEVYQTFRQLAKETINLFTDLQYLDILKVAHTDVLGSYEMYKIKSVDTLVKKLPPMNAQETQTLLLVTLESQQSQQYSHVVLLFDPEDSNAVKSALQVIPQITGGNKQGYSKILDVQTIDNNKFYVLVQYEQKSQLLFKLDTSDFGQIVQLNKHVEDEQFYQEHKDLAVLCSRISTTHDFQIKTLEQNYHLGITNLLEASIQDEEQVYIERLITLEGYMLSDPQKTCQHLGWKMNNQLSKLGDLQTLVIKELIRNNLFKKLAEVVLMRDDSLGGQWILGVVGSLRDQLEKTLEVISKNKMTQLLKLIKNHFAIGLSKMQVYYKSRTNILDKLQSQYVILEGILTVFNAFIKRQTEQARVNQASMRLDNMRQNELLGIKNMNQFKHERVIKLIYMVELLKFMVKSDFGGALNDYSFRLADMLDVQGALMLNQLMSFMPQCHQKKLPLTSLEDYIELIDSTLQLEKPLTVILYHGLMLDQIDNQLDIGSEFLFTMREYVSKDFCVAVKSAFSVDQLYKSVQSNALTKQKISAIELEKETKHAIEGLTGWRYQIDNSIIVNESFLLNRLVELNQPQSALMISSIFRSSEQSFVFNSVKVYNHLAKYSEAIMYLQDLETHKTTQETYEQAFKQVVDAAIKTNEFQNAILQVYMTPLQKQILQQFLKENYPNLQFAYETWTKRSIRAAGYGLQLNQKDTMNRSAQNQMRSEQAHQKCGFLTDEQRKACQVVSNLSPGDFETALIDRQAKQKSEFREKGLQNPQNARAQNIQDGSVMRINGDQITNNEFDYMIEPYQLRETRQTNYQDNQNCLSDFFFNDANDQNNHSNQQNFSSNKNLFGQTSCIDEVLLGDSKESHPNLMGDSSFPRMFEDLDLNCIVSANEGAAFNGDISSFQQADQRNQSAFHIKHDYSQLEGANNQQEDQKDGAINHQQQQAIRKSDGSATVARISQQQKGAAMHQGMVSYSTIRISDQDLRLSEDDGAQQLLKSPFKEENTNQDDIVEYMANEEDDQQDANEMQMFQDESIHDQQHQNSEHLVMGGTNQRNLSAVQEEPENESDQVSSNLIMVSQTGGKSSTERNKILKLKGQKVMQSQGSSFQQLDNQERMLTRSQARQKNISAELQWPDSS